MSILTAIPTHHQTLASLVALVENRAYPAGVSPQSPTYPYYTFQRISTPNSAGSHSGVGGLEEIRVQFTIRSRTALEADAIADAIKEGYLGFRGTMGDMYVTSVRLDNDMDHYDATTKIYGRMIDLFMWARPTP